MTQTNIFVKRKAQLELIVPFNVGSEDKVMSLSSYMNTKLQIVIFIS